MVSPTLKGWGQAFWTGEIVQRSWYTDGLSWRSPGGDMPLLRTAVLLLFSMSGSMSCLIISRPYIPVGAVDHIIQRCVCFLVSALKSIRVVLRCKNIEQRGILRTLEGWSESVYSSITVTLSYSSGSLSCLILNFVPWLCPVRASKSIRMTPLLIASKKHSQSNLSNIYIWS